MISVIIPLYNKQATIARSLQSVLNQSYNDLELIVVDDGSTDDGVDVVRRIEDSRIKLVVQENGGPSKARNTGVRHASGDWLVFLDADDEIVDGALRIMADKTSQYPEADLIDFNKYLRINGELVLQEHPIEGRVKNPLKAWYYRQIAPGCGHSIYRTSFITQYPYDERLRRYEDGELLIRMLPQARVYSTIEPSEIHDMDTAAASHARPDIKEDFVGYLDLSKGGFWHKMCVYRFFIEERDYYPQDCHRLYPHLYMRYDLLFLYKLLSR